MQVVHVSYADHLVGRLEYKDHRIFFEYAPDFLKRGLELSPYKLPLKAGIITCEDQVFEGLFGVFNDSLPDGWGRLLLDRKLMSLGINPGDLTPLDRLCYVGKQGMGALSYTPEIGNEAGEGRYDLDVIEEEILQFQDKNDSLFVDELLVLNASSAGARPKILISLVGDAYLATDNEASNHSSDWMIKLRSSYDPLDVGAIEYAYHLMAKAALLEVPEARLFPSKRSPGYFGVKRFDRTANSLLHMHSASGLIHADHRIPSLSYETLLKMTLWLTHDQRECEKQFRRAVFNVFAHNRDDHAKNFSFLMDGKGAWVVSPAYDLIFSSGPAGEHCTTILREGKNPGIEHLLKLAEAVEVDRKNAFEIIGEVKQAVSEWAKFAKEAHVTPVSTRLIQKAIEAIN